MNVEFFFRLLNEKLRDVRAAVEHLLSVLGDNEAKTKLDAAQAALDAANALASALSAQDRPGWLGTLQASLSRYTQRSVKAGEAHRLLRELFAIGAPLAEQTWANVGNDSGLDFEAVYRRYTDESKLGALFDEMVSKIDAMIASGQVDSMRVLKALEAVLATLKRNAKSTYFARYGAWEVASAYFRNFLWEALSELPGLGAATRALRKTYEDLDIELKTVRENAQSEIQRIAVTGAPDLIAPPVELRLLASGDENSDDSSADSDSRNDHAESDDFTA